MIEILFSEGAAGSMQLAKNIKNIAHSSTSVFYSREDDSFPTLDKLERKKLYVEDERNIKEKLSVPMEGTDMDIAYFPLNLSIGDISDPFSDERAEFLQSLVMIPGETFSGVGQEMMQTARKSLDKVLAAVERGQPVRIWTSLSPDEFCGLCHILIHLPMSADIRLVKLPMLVVLEDEIRTYTSWAEVEHTDFGSFQRLERPLAEAERRYFAGMWRELQAENGPLRAVVNGRLCTVGADFYDALILRELEKQPQEFHQARLIGTILGKYPLGLSDSLIALRIAEFISQGMLTPITMSEPNHPIYHRFLRKKK